MERTGDGLFKRRERKVRTEIDLVPSLEKGSMSVTRMVRNFSPTQYEAFSNYCERHWFLRWIMREPVAEQEHQKRGTDIHKQIENRTLTGAVSDHPYAPYVRAVEDILPAAGEEFYTELPVKLKTHLDIPWIGYIDLLRPTIRPIDLRDYKTTSNFRYAKTPAEIAKDIQINSYAEFVFQTLEEQDVDHGGVIRGTLHYIKAEAKNKPIPKKPKTLPVFADLDRAHVRKVWEGTRPTLDRMIEVAQLSDYNDVTPNSASCDKYPPDGCPFRKKCGHQKIVSTLSLTNPRPKENRVSYMDRIKNKNGAGNGTATTLPPPTPAVPPTPTPDLTPAPVPAPIPPAPARPSFMNRKRALEEQQAANTGVAAAAQAAQQPFSIIPPDAPPRDSGGADPVPDENLPDVEAAVETPEEQVTETTKGRGRPKGSTAQKGFTIYVDCMVTKGLGKVLPTNLDDWFGPIEEALNAAAAEEGHEHWMELTFGPQKALLSKTVQAWIAKGLPPVMLVTSSSNTAREVLPMLLPHATTVVRSLRG